MGRTRWVVDYDTAKATSDICHSPKRPQVLSPSISLQSVTLSQPASKN